MYTELKLATLKQSKGRNGWFRAASAAFMNLTGTAESPLASGDKSLIAVDISSAKENRAAPIQLYFTPEDARAFAAALLAHANGEALTAEELADFAFMWTSGNCWLAKPAEPGATKPDLQPKPLPEYRALFDETGGYDLMTGAWILTRDSDNCVIATLDQRDYGQKSCDFEYRSAEAGALANRIVAALNTGGKVYRAGCTCVAGCDLCDADTPSRDGLTAEELADFAKPAEAGAQAYTIIGLYGETGEVLTCTQTATGPHEAMAITAKEIVAKWGRYSDVELLCAIPGDHSPVCACEDAGKCADIADLAPAEGEEE